MRAPARTCAYIHHTKIWPCTAYTAFLSGVRLSNMTHSVAATLCILNQEAETLWQRLHSTWPDFSVEVLASIDSSNTELMRRARAGQRSPTLLVALEQTAGRGRRGKSWSSAPGTSLTFSLGLPYQPIDWSGLSLAVGVSVADSLHPKLRLKWPNDLWLEKRKLGGILIEAATLGKIPYVVVGIGLNIALPATLPTQPALTDEAAKVALLPVPPAALQEVLPEHHIGHVLRAVVPALADDLCLFEHQGFAAFGQRFAARDALLGQALILSDGQTGQAAGAAADGALRLQTSTGYVNITNAEVSVRPR